jgi:hypothetical protein
MPKVGGARPQRAVPRCCARAFVCPRSVMLVAGSGSRRGRYESFRLSPIYPFLVPAPQAPQFINGVIGSSRWATRSAVSYSALSSATSPRPPSAGFATPAAEPAILAIKIRAAPPQADDLGDEAGRHGVIPISLVPAGSACERGSPPDTPCVFTGLHVLRSRVACFAAVGNGATPYSPQHPRGSRLRSRRTIRVGWRCAAIAVCPLRSWDRCSSSNCADWPRVALTWSL